MSSSLEPLFTFFKLFKHFSFQVRLLDGLFQDAVRHLSDWTYYVLNYIGLDDGQGLQIYQNGIKAVTDTTKTPYTATSGNGRVVIGKYYTDATGGSVAFNIDELLVFNTKLSDEEIMELNDMF